MLNFGKSSTNRKGLIRRRTFDTLVQVGPRMQNDNFDPFENERFMRSLTTGSAKKVAHPKRDGVEVHLIKRDYRDFDLGLDNDEDVSHGYTRRSLRENREFNVWLNTQRKIKALQERFWRMSRAEAEQQINDERRNKPKRSDLGDLFLESNLDGEEKIARYEAREHRRKHRTNGSYERPAKSWKSFGEKNVWIRIPTSDLETTKNDTKLVPIGGTRFKARKSWATKKPKFHCAWTIGEETCATFLVWQRQDEEWERECDEAIARDMDRENEAEMRASYNDACYEAECDALEVLEGLYRKGDWCVEDDVEVNPELDQIDMMERHFDKGFRVYQRAA